MSTTVVLKVDVDTYIGAREGLPRLDRLLQERSVQATFCVTMGPDNSGRALRRVFTRKGFLRKMLRTRAPATYGWRTLAYGTLLPAPLVGSRMGRMLRHLENAGHEIIPHGWDHVGWQDGLTRMEPDAVRHAFRAGYDACAAILGHAPSGSASPGWQCTESSLAVQDEAGLLYHSDTRGSAPYRPRLNGHRSRAVEIPTTLPTLDEIWGTPAVRSAGLLETMARLLRPGRLNVLTVHAETEGRAHLEFLGGLISRWRGQGAQFVRLVDVARSLRREQLPDCGILQGEIPGRAGKVACQGQEMRGGVAV